jgi:hypothetical protein
MPLFAQNLINSRAFLEGIFGYHFSAHLFHIKHECIQGLLHMLLILE